MTTVPTVVTLKDHNVKLMVNTASKVSLPSKIVNKDFIIPITTHLKAVKKDPNVALGILLPEVQLACRRRLWKFKFIAANGQKTASEVVFSQTLNS